MVANISWRQHLIQFECVVFGKVCRILFSVSWKISSVDGWLLRLLARNCLRSSLCRYYLPGQVEAAGMVVGRHSVCHLRRVAAVHVLAAAGSKQQDFDSLRGRRPPKPV